jgi:hypothetical protein
MIRRGAYWARKIAMPKATGIARIRANNAANTVTCSRSKMPKCIAEVFVVTQLPP